MLLSRLISGSDEIKKAEQFLNTVLGKDITATLPPLPVKPIIIVKPRLDGLHIRRYLQQLKQYALDLENKKTGIYHSSSGIAPYELRFRRDTGHPTDERLLIHEYIHFVGLLRNKPAHVFLAQALMIMYMDQQNIVIPYSPDDDQTCPVSKYLDGERAATKTNSLAEVDAFLETAAKNTAEQNPTEDDYALGMYVAGLFHGLTSRGYKETELLPLITRLLA